MVNPPIHPFSGVEGIGEDLGDLQFVQDRIKAGEWFEVSGNINALNNTIEFIVPNLKTAILFEAKVVIGTNTGASGVTSGSDAKREQVTADLLINAVVKDKTSIGHATAAAATGGTNLEGRGSGSGHGMQGDGRFNALGKSLVGNGTKKIEIKNVDDDASVVYATMSGWLFTT